MQEIRQKIEREDLQHKHAITRMKNLLTTARAGSVIPTPSATINSDKNSVVVTFITNTWGRIGQELNMQNVKQQIEMEAFLQHSNRIRKMQAFLASAAESPNN